MREGKFIFSLFFFEGEEKKNLKFVFKNTLWQQKVIFNGQMQLGT